MNSSVIQFQEAPWDLPGAEDCSGSWNDTSYVEDTAQDRTYQEKSRTFVRRSNWNTSEQSCKASERSSYPPSASYPLHSGSRQNSRGRFSSNEQRGRNPNWRNDSNVQHQDTAEHSSTWNKYNKTQQNSKNRYSYNEKKNQDLGRQSNYSNRYSNNDRRDYNRMNRQDWNNKFDNVDGDEKAQANNEKIQQRMPFEGSERTKYEFKKSQQRNTLSDGEKSKYQYNDKLEIMVPVSCIGRIIGRQGARIRSLEESSQARIQIQNANTSNQDDEVSVTITGLECAREKAKELINEIINQGSSNRPQEYSYNYSREGRQDNKHINTYSKEEKYDSNSIKEPQKHEDTQAAEESPGIINWAEIIAASAEERKKRWQDIPTIKKDFYFEDPEIARMTKDAVAQFRKEQNNISIQCLDDDDDRCLPNPVTSFEQAFKKYPGIIKEIEKQEFEQPSPIQCQAWPVLLQGHDLIGIAQTGTGKTLAFLLPAFIHIDNQVTPREERKGPSCLIFAPTRELAQQIERETNKYTYKGIKCVCIYGGGNRREQIQSVERGVEIVIATPGRLNDLVMNNFLDVTCVTYLVLDEADRMLDMGFEPQIKKVLLDIRPDRQTVMTTATWPEEVRRMASQYMTKPMLVFVGSLDIRAVHSVRQEVVFVDADDKKPVLYEFINSMKPEDKVIVFVDKKIVADDVASDLLLNGIECQSIHGDREQCDREQALEDLRTGFARILVATDVASRGLDIKDITHIFNFDFPRNIEEYVHRVGRTGRAGQTGSSITLMTRSDWSKSQPLIDIMEEAGQEVPQELYDMAERYKTWKDKKDAEDAYSRRGGGRQGGRRFNKWKQDDRI